MSRGCRADAAEPVCRGRCNTATEHLEQLQRNRVGRHAQAYGVLTAGHLRRHVVVTLQYQGQRPRPECTRQSDGIARTVARPVHHPFGIRQMNDQRMIGRAPFRFEDATDRGRIACIGAKPVDGFCRKRDQLAGA